MKKYVSIRDEEYNDILKWLKEEYAETYSLSEEEAIGMRDTFSFQRWRLRKAYHELAVAMRETRLGSILIWVIEKINKILEKIFC
ncbi:hypothetical protein ES703_21528 [subsurface metagenome]